MNPPLLDMTWAATFESVTLSDLSEVCGLSRAELDELIDYGALAPMQMAMTEIICAYFLAYVAICCGSHVTMPGKM